MVCPSVPSLETYRAGGSIEAADVLKMAGGSSIFGIAVWITANDPSHWSVLLWISCFEAPVHLFARLVRWPVGCTMSRLRKKQPLPVVR